MLLIAGYILVFFILVYLLVKSADLVLSSIKSLSKKTGTKLIILSSLVLSVATSFPELFVGILSAISGTSDLSLGNILGANVTNISLVAGFSAIVAGGVVIHGQIIAREFILAAIAGSLPIFLGLDGTLSKVDGAILLLIYFAYIIYFYKDRFLKIGQHHLNSNFVSKFFRKVVKIEKETERSMGHFLVGVAALLFTSELIVQVAKNIATNLHIPIFVIGLILLSLGTTLPELIVSFRSLREGESEVFFGNLLGSVVVNATLVLAFVALINPISTGKLEDFLIPGIFFLITFALFWIFAKTKKKITRLEGAFLLLLYLIFIVVSFLQC